MYKDVVYLYSELLIMHKDIIGQMRQPMKNIILFHITSAIAGEALAVLAAIVSLLFLFQHRLLKLRRINALIQRLPSLEKLENNFLRLLLLGFILLSFSLVSGIIIYYYYAPKAVDEYKILWAISVWFWYLAVFILKIFFQKNRLFTAQMSALGCLLLSAALFGFIFQ